MGCCPFPPSSHTHLDDTQGGFLASLPLVALAFDLGVPISKRVLSLLLVCANGTQLGLERARLVLLLEVYKTSRV